MRQMYGMGVIAVTEVERILIMASWNLRETMIVSLILPLVSTRNQVSNDLYKSNWSLKTLMKHQKVNMVKRMK